VTADFGKGAGDAFEQAWASAPAGDWSFGLGGQTFRLRIAGEAMAQRFLPALAHLTSEALSPSLAVGCWDRKATGVSPPPPPWPLDALLPHGRVRGHTHHRVRMTYDSWMRMLCVYDRHAGVALVSVADAARVPDWVDRAPLRTILTWWAGDLGAAFLHASAVADVDGAVVLAGGSGTGKSTTAMACLADGMGFIGDDACLVHLDDDPVVFSVYGRAKLERDAFLRLPTLGDLALDEKSDPVVLDASTRLVHRAPLRAVLLTCLTGAGRSRLTPVARAEARRQLVAASILEGGSSALRPLSRLVTRVPCYRFELGSDLGEVVGAVRTIVRSG